MANQPNIAVLKRRVDTARTQIEAHAENGSETVASMQSVALAALQKSLESLKKFLAHSSDARTDSAEPSISSICDNNDSGSIIQGPFSEFQEASNSLTNSVDELLECTMQCQREVIDVESGFVPLGKDIETAGVELWEATERLQEALHHKETEDAIMKLEYDGLAQAEAELNTNLGDMGQEQEAMRTRQDFTWKAALSSNPLAAIPGVFMERNARSLMKRKWKIQDEKLEVNRRLNRSRLEMEALKQERTNALSSLETARRLARDYETLTREVRDWKKSIVERTHAYQKLKEHLGSLALRTDEVGCKLRILDGDEEAETLRSELMDLMERFIRAEDEASRNFLPLPKPCISPAEPTFGFQMPLIASSETEKNVLLQHIGETCRSSQEQKEEENRPALPPRREHTEVSFGEEDPIRSPPPPPLPSRPRPDGFPIFTEKKQTRFSIPQPTQNFEWPSSSVGEEPYLRVHRSFPPPPRTVDQSHQTPTGLQWEFSRDEEVSCLPPPRPPRPVPVEGTTPKVNISPSTVEEVPYFPPPPTADMIPPKRLSRRHTTLWE